MSVLQFVASLVHSLAWPAVLVVLIVVARQQIQESVMLLARRLERLRVGGADLSFLAQQIEEVLPQEPPTLTANAGIARGTGEALDATAETQPIAGPLDDLWTSVGYAPFPAMQIAQARVSSEAAPKWEKLDAAQRVALTRLTHLSATASIDPNGVTSAVASEYLQLAERFLRWTANVH